MQDLFDTPELLPAEVRETVDTLCHNSMTYEGCEKLVSELNKLGYTCDYYLDAIPFDLQKLN